MSRTSVGKVKVKSKKSSNFSALPGQEEEVLFLIFYQVPQISIFHPPGPSSVRFEGDCFLSSLQGALRC